MSGKAKGMCSVVANGKTIKQIADEVGVSKTAINKQIDNLSLRSSLQKNGNQFAIDGKLEVLIKNAFEEKTKAKNANQSQTESQTNANQLYDILRAELETKNQIIKAQQQTIDELIATNKEQAQSINAERQSELADKIIEGHKMIEGSSDSTEQEVSKKKNGWQFWKK